MGERATRYRLIGLISATDAPQPAVLGNSTPGASGCDLLATAQVGDAAR